MKNRKFKSRVGLTTGQQVSSLARRASEVYLAAPTFDGSTGDLAIPELEGPPYQPRQRFGLTS